MKVVVALVMLGVLASQARADDEAAAADTLVKAIAAQDVASFTRVVGDHVHVAGLWFPSTDCQAFKAKQELAAPEYAAFLRCAASLDLRVETTTTTTLWGDTAPHPRTVLAFDPGGEIDVHVKDGRVRDIVGLQLAVSGATVTGAALWAHVVSGPPQIEPDVQVREAIARDANAVAFAFLIVCVDEAGKVAGGQLGMHSEQFPTYVQAVKAAAAHWMFKPFLYRGKPIPVCSFASLSYPADRTLRPPQSPSFLPSLPLASPPPNIAPKTLDALRIAGEKNIAPDDDTKLEMGRAGKGRVIGSYKICISTQGTVSQVNMLKSTGFLSYDQKIVSTMRGEWRYRPYIGNDGQPSAACTAVTFIYSQPLPPPPPPP